MKTIREQYQQQVRRILRRVKAMQGRGYEVPETIVPKTPKRITSASVRRLKKITPSTIAQKSKYYGELSYGAETAGAEAYRQELEESRRKAQETRRRRKEEKERQRDEQEQFERERREKDRQERDRLRDDESYRRKFEQAKISFDQLDAVITQTGVYNPVAETEMREHLSNVISRYGENHVLLSIQDNQTELTHIASTLVRYNPGSRQYESLMNNFDRLIGYVRTAQEKRADDDRLDQSESIEPLE